MKLRPRRFNRVWLNLSRKARYMRPSRIRRLVATITR